MVFMETQIGEGRKIGGIKNRYCPFCGGENVSVTNEDSFKKLVEEHGSAMMKFRCKKCDMELPLYNVPEENYWLGVGILLAMWNNRNGGTENGN